MEFVYALIAALAVSAISLIGIILMPHRWTHKKEVRFLGFAAGVLLATATLQLLPEAIEGSRGMQAFYALLGGMLTFFLIERVVSGFHTHHPADVGAIKSASYLVIIGDSLHNFLDGIAIGVAFLINPMLGFVTTLAIAAHELPQEIADYTILIKGGFSRAKALLVNFASALTAILGVIIVFALGDILAAYEGILLGATAGMFLYIAAVDIIPELNHQHNKQNDRFGIPFLTGIVVMALLFMTVPHDHGGHDTGAHHETDSQHQVE